jgi:hypothetical protein
MLTKICSLAEGNESLDAIEKMGEELLAAGYPARIVPTTRKSSIRMQYRLHTMKFFPKPRYTVGLIVEKDGEMFTRYTPEKAEEAGEIIGFMTEEDTKPGEKRIGSVPLLEDKGNEQAITKVRYYVKTLAEAWHAQLSEGE